MLCVAKHVVVAEEAGPAQEEQVARCPTRPVEVVPTVEPQPQPNPVPNPNPTRSSNPNPDPNPDPNPSPSPNLTRWRNAQPGRWRW